MKEAWNYLENITGEIKPGKLGAEGITRGTPNFSLSIMMLRTKDTETGPGQPVGGSKPARTGTDDNNVIDVNHKEHQCREVFPQDCRKAYVIGAALVNKPV